jgi:dihydroxyacetone kinase
MSNLNATIQKLSAAFASDIVHAIRSMSLEDIASLSGGGGGHARHTRRGPGRPRKAAKAVHHAAPRHSKRLARRSTADLSKMVNKIVSLVKSHKKGINAEGIRAALKVPRKELPRPMAMALDSKKIRKKGRKRATMYFGA